MNSSVLRRGGVAASGNLVEDNYTVSKVAAGEGDWRIYLKRVFGRRRARTLRLRARIWQRVRGWLLASGRCLRPCGKQGVCGMIVYLELAKCQCPRTHPRAVISSLNLFETTGCVEVEDRIVTNAHCRRFGAGARDGGFAAST